MGNGEIKLKEIKGDVIFYTDDSLRVYQAILGSELRPLKKGTWYKPIDKIGIYGIKYNLNGQRGFSLWKGNMCVKDDIWTVEEVKKLATELSTVGIKNLAEIPLISCNIPVHLLSALMRAMAHLHKREYGFELNRTQATVSLKDLADLPLDKLFMCRGVGVTTRQYIVKILKDNGHPIEEVKL